MEPVANFIPFSNLPDDVKKTIFSFVSAKVMASNATVSREWHNPREYLLRDCEETCIAWQGIPVTQSINDKLNNRLRDQIFYLYEHPEARSVTHSVRIHNLMMKKKNLNVDECDERILLNIRSEINLPLHK